MRPISHLQLYRRRTNCSNSNNEVRSLTMYLVDTNHPDIAVIHSKKLKWCTQILLVLEITFGSDKWDTGTNSLNANPNNKPLLVMETRWHTIDPIIHAHCCWFFTHPHYALIWGGQPLNVFPFPYGFSHIFAHDCLDLGFLYWRFLSKFGTSCWVFPSLIKFLKG